MIQTMAPPTSTSAAPLAPELLQPLVKQLAALSEDDRELVIRAANVQGLPNELPALSREDSDEEKGTVALGGNADDDCKALYDSFHTVV